MREKRPYVLETPWLAFMDAVIAIIPIIVVMIIVFMAMKNSFDLRLNQVEHFFLLNDKEYDSEYLFKIEKKEDGIYLVKNFIGILFDDALDELRNDIQGMQDDQIFLEVIFSLDDEGKVDVDELFDKYVNIKSNFDRTLPNKKITYSFRKVNILTPPIILLKSGEINVKNYFD